MCVCKGKWSGSPIQILQLISIKPTAVGHFVIAENDGDESVGRREVKTMVLTRKGESLASSRT